MKDKDQELLWEAYKKGDKALKAGKDAKGPKVSRTAKDADEDTEGDESFKKGDKAFSKLDENIGGAQLPEDLIYTALETAGSDWESAVRLIGQAIGEHIINDVKYSGAGPLNDKDMAESWSYREGVKVAMDDLFAQGISDNIDEVFKAAFHSASDEQYSALDMLGYEPEDYEHDDIDQAAMDRMGVEQEL